MGGPKRGEMTQPDGAQRRPHQTPTGREDRADDQYLDMPPHRAREARREGRQAYDTVRREEQPTTTSCLIMVASLSYLFLASKWRKSSSLRLFSIPQSAERPCEMWVPEQWCRKGDGTSPDTAVIPE